MAALAPSSQDRWLDLNDVLRDLVAEGYLGQDDAETALTQRRSAVNIQLHPLEFLASLQFDDLKRPGKKLDVETLTAWLAKTCGQPYMRIDPLKINVAAVTPLMSYAFAQRHKILAVAVDRESVTIASAQPYVRSWEGDLTHVLKLQIKRVVANPTDIQRMAMEFFRLAKSVSGASASEQKMSNMGNFEQLLKLGASDQEPDANDAHIVNIVDWLFQYAFQQRASDIHIEPRREQGTVRFRIDGVLHEAEAPPSSSSAAVISRVKIMARLDIAERRLPQDGRIMLRIQGKELDLRVSTVPTSFGESVVMRLLDRQTINFDFPSLGFDGERLDEFLDVLERPHGILLVTGPTGSGKTTTLYTALSRLNTAERKIITVEDPVEYQLEGINQIQVKPSIGLDFAGALRSIVRQDPDVIMIGEMRDLETCRIAIQSSLTGHLVLSTLHTNSAAASITRLLDMGVESYLIASTVNGILAQRLVRRLDPATREAFDAPPELIAEHGLERFTDERPIRLYRPRADAPGGGYRGRSAITELLVMNEELRSLLMRHADASTLEEAARRGGLRTLHEEGLRQAVAGMTSLEEVLRVTRGEGT
ncbi:Type II secretion system protein E [Pseudomonas savastanoi pv. fraxini]|uniref:GspE/PulE family protein n=2 Tax=Pseudomonas savastanoi TaxID=29438 RepID=UPI000EFF32AB|nr:ATPase, T2SS/T4P/T4SS family [Pseudomonas savastanoi]RMR70185.1 Type II secretion system protein E [Pseudomonas savastanoi pv. fraxini]